MQTTKMAIILCFMSVLVACGQVSPIETIATSTKTERPTSVVLSKTSTTLPTLTATQSPSPTPIPPTSTFTQTPTMTPPPTLDAEEVEETIRTLLREPADCSIPCFWGIVPGQTTLNEANDIFNHLGLQLEQTNTRENKDFYAVVYDFDNGLSITAILTVQDQIVENLSIKISPEEYQLGIPREWLAFSPETLIKQYGVPSRVELVMIAGPGTSTYFEMDIYFDAEDTIVVYEGSDMIALQTNSLYVCPPIAPFDFVRILIGKNPEHPPRSAVPLEVSTGMTLEEFAKLLSGEPETACIKLKGEVFFP